MDNLYHQSQEKIILPVDWNNIQKKLVKSRKWIIDGNFPRTWHIRIKTADTIFFFEFPIWFSIWRVLARKIKYFGTNKPDMPPGVKEKVGIKDIKKLFIFPKSEELINTYKLDDKKLIVFKNNKEAEEFLESLRNTMGG